MRSLALAVLLSLAGLAIAAASAGPPQQPATRGVGSHPFALETQTPVPNQQGPSMGEVQSEEAQVSTPGPGTTLVESLPSFPIPAAADPYVQNAPSQQQQQFLRGHTVLTRPAARDLGPGHHVGNMLTVGGQNVTGLNTWWTFASGSINGLGDYLVNVATGNLVVRARDLAFPHRGMVVAFNRTYNSYSQHDWNNSDQSGVDSYGDGWTNSFDMHIVKNSLSGGAGISVFDANGARYDYEKDCTPSCVYKINSPVGQYAILTYDNNTGWYYWTTKSGIVFLFHNLSDNAGVAGRLSKIWSRNNNAKLIFTYSFDTGASPAPATLNTISVSTDTTNGSTQTAQLSFSNVATTSGTRRLLTSLLWPDGSTSVAYKYDTSGRLVEVDEPTNNTANTSLPQLYQYSATGYLLTQANGPRWSLDSASPAPTPAPLGGYVQFAYNGDSVTTIQSYGYINPTVNDDSGSGPVQSNLSGTYGISAPYRQVYFAYSTVSPAPSPAPSQTPSGAACTSTGNTPVYDTDGHDVVFCWDSSDRVVQTDQWTGTFFLATHAGWDSNNNLVLTKDARSNETDMAYDGNGNLIARALPAASTGSPRPTTLFTYDASNNLVATCDPVWSDANGFDWQSTPSPTYSPCPASHANSPTNPGPTLATYAPSSPEPFGELTAVTKPMGYTVTSSYSPGPQAGSLDYGQPTEVKGASIAQADGTTITPTTDLYYDSYGNLICKVTRGSVDASPTWGTSINVYTGSDALMGRATQSADPDDASLSNSNHNGACPKTAGISGSTIVSSYTYFANGQIKTRQSPVERAASVSTSFAYDADGDPTTETRHFGSGASPAPETRMYDADGRLVEVVKPESPVNVGWDTRYDYDLSQSGTTAGYSPTLLGVTSPLNAHGALFKTQELDNSTWIDLNGTAYDAANRVTAKYTYAPNFNCTNLSNYSTCEPVSTTHNNYDGSPGPGLLASSTDAIGTKSQLTYDDLGRVTAVSFTDTTPGRATTYDLDGRVLSISNTCSACSGDTESYQYDRDGNPTRVSESPVDNSDPTILSNTYYLDGMREYISAAPEVSPAPGAMNQTNLFTFDYNADGRLANKTLAYSSPSPTTAPFSYTYTLAGRPTGQRDIYKTTTSTYDAPAGRLATIAYPEGTETFNAYDPAGEELSFTEPDQTTSDTQDFDGSAELIQQNSPSNVNSDCYPEPLGFTAVGVNGYMKASTWELRSDGCSDVGISGTEDVRNATAVSIPLTCTIGGMSIPCQGPATFDADGRLTSFPISVLNGLNFVDDNRSYDAQNRFIEQTDSSGDVLMERHYSPGGRIRQIATADSSHALHWETLHWDEGVILFTTSDSGVVDDIKVGASADYFPSDPHAAARLTVWDRDYTGHMRGCHNGGPNNGTSLWSPLDSMNAGAGGPLQGVGGGNCVLPAMFNLPIGQGGATLKPDGDGYWDGFVVFQGVRDYDLKMRGWTEPDPLAGSAREPMSQKRYAWNSDNPSSNLDPSGMMPPGGDNPSYDPSAEWLDGAINPGFDGGDYTANGVPIDIALGPLPNVNPSINAMNGWAQVWSTSFGWGTDKKGRPALVLHDSFLGWAFSATVGAAVIYRAVDQQELQSIQELGRYGLGPNGAEGKAFFATEEQAQSFADRMGSDDDPYTVTSTEVDDDYANQPGVEVFYPATEGTAYFFRGEAVPDGPVTIGPNGGGSDPFVSEGNQ